MIPYVHSAPISYTTMESVLKSIVGSIPQDNNQSNRSHSSTLFSPFSSYTTIIPSRSSLTHLPLTSFSYTHSPIQFPSSSPTLHHLRIPLSIPPHLLKQPTFHSLTSSNNPLSTPHPFFPPFHPPPHSYTSLSNISHPLSTQSPSLPSFHSPPSLSSRSPHICHQNEWYALHPSHPYPPAHSTPIEIPFPSAPSPLRYPSSSLNSPKKLSIPSPSLSHKHTHIHTPISTQPLPNPLPFPPRISRPLSPIHIPPCSTHSPSTKLFANCLDYSNMVSLYSTHPNRANRT